MAWRAREHGNHPFGAILVDAATGTFKVARKNFVDEEILDAERERIFNHCWIYVGHGSEIPKAGDFITRKVAGRGIILNRDSQGVVRALMNTCPHRGAQVCRESKGNSKSFQCFYHGWVFGQDGALRSQNLSFKTPPTSGAGRFYIGRSRNSAAWRSFKGKVDDLRIYDRLLSRDDIIAQMGTKVVYRNFTAARAGLDQTAITIPTPGSTTKGAPRSAFKI